MTKFTKERLEEIAELARKAKYKPCAMHMTNLLAVCDSEVIEEMARQLLASMEQEPVAYMHHSGQVVTRGECCDDKIFAICCKVETPLYATPPSPVVPDDLLSMAASAIEDLLEHTDPSTNYYSGVWADVPGKLRAAMLQSFGNPEQLDEVGSWNNHMNTPTAQAGNSPVTPDDVLRMDWLVSKTVDVREPMVYGSHSIFWSQTITDEDDDYHATKLREQIDAAMASEQAAAPKQEDL